jgi:dTDP-4-amino-4,6-dideoxygalactose transaminase
MDEIRQVAEPQGVALVEDACHALGVPDIGSTRHSQIACFSTHPVKAIATGEGGVAVTASETLAGRMKRLRSHGMTRDAAEFREGALASTDGKPNPWYYEMHEIGWNYRQSDILCALGVAQLAKLEAFWRRRNEIASLYDRLLLPLAPAVKPVSRRQGPHGWHLYAVLIDFAALGISRADLMRALFQSGIGTQVHYIPVNRQPYYKDQCGETSLRGAEAYYARCLSLPLFTQMTDDDARYVVERLTKIVAR